MNFTRILALSFALLSTTIAPAFASVKDAPQSYLRKDTQEIVVFVNDGKLYCRRIADNFELCHGMEEQPDGSWTGDKMKHPDMPGFMTFNGTVTFREGELTIKGCAVGNSMCDSEVWIRQ